MRSSRMLWITAICALPLTACVSLAPGADKVRITMNAADVSTCTAVGNINVPGGVEGRNEAGNASNELRNQAVGLGGNAVLVTLAVLGVPAQGVVYRCP